MIRVVIAIGAILALAPIAIVVLDLAGRLPPPSGHGLGEWFLISGCFAVESIAIAINALLVRRATRTGATGLRRTLPRLCVILGIAGLATFTIRWGVPFSK